MFDGRALLLVMTIAALLLWLRAQPRTHRAFISPDGEVVYCKRCGREDWAENGEAFNRQECHPEVI